MSDQGASPYYVYIGTYTNIKPFAQGRAEGIYVYRMDPANGGLSYLHTITGVANPSFLTLSPDARYLYAVGETDNGTVHAYAVDGLNGNLTTLNQQPSHGDAPCHISVDHSGRWVMVANYSSGSVAIYPRQSDGSLGAASDVIQHHGKSVNPQRQEGPHAHCILPTPDNRYAVVADLGLDRLFVYRLDQDQGKLIPNDPPWTQIHPGAGPRQLAFHPNGKYAYLLNEIDATMDALAYDEARGTFEILQTMQMLPEGHGGTRSGSAIRVEPEGKYVYASNRGHDSIVIYAVDQASGKVRLVGHASTQGKIPRDFGIDPSGTFLLAANQQSDSLVSFRINHSSGQLDPSGQVADVKSPVCVIYRNV